MRPGRADIAGTPEARQPAGSPPRRRALSDLPVPVVAAKDIPTSQK